MHDRENAGAANSDSAMECSSSAPESSKQETDVGEAQFSLDISPREAAWKPSSERIRLVEAMASSGASPREVVESLLPDVTLPEDMPNDELCRIIQQIIHSDRPKRDKLTNYNTFNDAVELFRRSTRILVLTGAGVSVSCGIPDFRSKDGIYARLRLDFPDLPDPTAMFDISYFVRNPKPFFEFAAEIFPGQFKASVCHHFIKMLETEGKLLRNYTQNIDTLEQVAGITRIVQCHGSFSKATCRHCGARFDGSAIKEDVLAKRIAMCPKCGDAKGVLKPDIVFFGEDLPDEFHDTMLEDKDEVDLVVVIGSSLKVQPVALIPFSVDSQVPQILINREPLPHYSTPDIELLGNCDDIIAQLALALGHPFTELLAPASLNNHKNGEVDAKCAVEIAVRKEMNETDFKRLANEPDAKRMRTQDDTAPIWEGRYVNVESKLPEDAFLFLSPNRTVFPGAELFYDKDDDVFCQLRANHYTTPSLSSNSSDSESDSEETQHHRIHSVPAMSCCNQTKTRADSCPPAVCGADSAQDQLAQRKLDAQITRRTQHRAYLSECTQSTVPALLRMESMRHEAHF